MSGVVVSLCLLAVFVLLCELSRRILTKLLAPRGLCLSAVYAVELVSTLQLCICNLELRLLGEVGRLQPQFCLSLTYLASVVHGLTFHGALGNPCSTLEYTYRGRLTARSGVLRMVCQFMAASVARTMLQGLWTLGLSDLHLRHTLQGSQCISPIHTDTHTSLVLPGPLVTAAAVELAGAFAMQTAFTHTHTMDQRYRVHAIAALTATLTYAGGKMTGAVFNPALALSTQFSCSGHSFLDYCLVYWLAPLLGMMCSVLLFDQMLSGRDAPYRPLLANKRK
ncbi:aquaporin-11-like [Oncorhynchus nerka]|uniref:aquaporin-11-like n=1 Tax=Oncorhynchus nerka TaxID=8023 RepID=UPI00112FF16F|nr:aquaporin-11-like [Oncorhynchus nerka]